MVKRGRSLTEVADQMPKTFVIFSPGLHRLADILKPPRDFKTSVIWLHGPTGVGKSRWAFENTTDRYYKNPTTKWWCGYNGQQEVIMDDFRPSKEMPFHYILALFDRYPFTVEIKGGTCQFTSRRIIVTSPFTVEETLNQDTLQWVNDENRQQFKRRITIEMKVTKPFPWVLKPWTDQETEPLVSMNC